MEDDPGFRAESEARHNERIKQVNEALEKHTNAMKANLTKREGRDQTRQDLESKLNIGFD